ncbi:hypothetical protein ET495_15525 [Xylanimonas allomyrinae]|uniref:Uncharacterized protein n=1 Tax=Xylanimonas allomyrinae TaxID=2509459 RepID=A0A4P6EPJ2_9MICO|nr:hypothetical protein [Xylanimonas allomyrinae]QAY64386.1 hypothetical protein ET495_15525 [Xylanimonas allomyrinae]
MTTTSERLRRVFRMSGYTAAASVAVCLVAAGVVLTRGDVVPAPTASAWVGAGQAVHVALGSRGPVWGVGARLDPEAVRCEWTSRHGESGTLDMGAAGARTSEGTSEGTAVLLGDAEGTEAHTVVCSGGGLERFAVAAPTTAPPAAALGVGFIAFAVVAAVWAVVSLRSTRRRSS